MDTKELEKLAGLPESETLEFKMRLPARGNLPRLIASLANTRGGKLIIGVGESGEVIGVDDPERAQKTLERAALKVSPPVSLESQIVELSGRPVVVATVQQSNYPPHLVDGQAFQRAGSSVVPIRSTTLYSSIRERATDVDAVLREVKRLTVVVEQLNKQLIADGGWRSRMTDWVVGGFVGVIISFLFALLLGVG